ncbi:MAG TPA: hypothetical protein VLG09_04930 [Candidatus Saccharimonadales bacterium]|nr:hypothetical protein [Candidatus Saccharimonadales bacterium]
MARLPTPGSDANSWGEILNDFLSQAHSVTGGLKNGVVSSVSLQDESVNESKLAVNAVTTSKLAGASVTSAKLANNAVATATIQDGAITSSKLAPGVGGSTDAGIRSLLIHYAPPNVTNAKYDDNYAAGVLSRYDDVVLGAGLEDSGSVYYASTVAIIAKIAALSPETVVWGYVDCGVTTGNLSLATLQAQIDQWIAIGAKGIFCDVIGYAYHVPRSRQNAIINYIHSKNVGAILNVFNPDEVLSSSVDATYNPAGTATTANSSDVLLLESWVCNSDAYTVPFYATFSDIKTRGDKALAYRASMGIRIFAANIMSHNDHTFDQLKDYRDYAEAFARVWRLDGTGIAASNYGSTGSDAGLVTPQFTSFKPLQKRISAPYVLNGGWTEVQAPDLGIVVTYDTGTYTWQQR